MSEGSINIDEVLKHIGEFGLYQRRLYFLLCIPMIFVGALNLSYVFIAAKPNYRCVVPSCDFGKSPAYNNSFVDFTIPLKNDGKSIDECSRYVYLNNSAWSSAKYTLSTVLQTSGYEDLTEDEEDLAVQQLKEDKAEQCTPDHFSKMSTEDCPEGHVFDTFIYKSTIITEFNLTCNDDWEAKSSQSIYFAGMLVGAITWGLVSDCIGRRITIVINFVLMATTGIATALVPNMALFNIMRFLNAMTSVGVFQTAFVLGLEFVGPGYRIGCSMVGQYVFAMGEVILGCLGLYFRGWRMLQLIISAPLTIGLLYWFIVPESPRWLQTRNKHRAFRDLMQQVAKTNKKVFPDHLFTVDEDVTSETSARQLSSTSSSYGQQENNHRNKVTFTGVENEIESASSSVGATGATTETTATRGSMRDIDDEQFTSYDHEIDSQVSFLQLLKTPLLALRLFSMMFIWMVTTLVYYGLSMNSMDLSTDTSSPNKPYVNFILTALVEVPGYTLAWILQQSVGRKMSLCLSLLLAGFSCIGAALVFQLPPMHSLVASLVGKCGITSVFSIIYLYTAEIFPTNVRNSVLGSCSMVARIGGMLAPFSNDMFPMYPALPLYVFGTLSMVAVLAAIVQPETKGCKLPDTIQQALSLGSRRSGVCGTAAASETGPLLENINQ